MADKIDSQITQPTIPTKLGSVAVVAAFLARYDLFKRTGIPSSKQMELYRRPDDQYFCAVEGCETCGPSQRGNKTMVTMGPIVLCHSHARDVLNDLREGFGKQLDPTDTGRTPPRWFHPLNKTLFVIGRKEDESDEEGLAFWHEKTNKEMTGRAQHLAEALAWAPGHREWYAHQVEHNEARAESERLAGLPPAPEVNPYMGKTIGQLKKLEAAAAEALEVLKAGKGDLTEADYANMLKAYGDTMVLVQEAISATKQKLEQKAAEKKSADMLKKLAALNVKLGLTGNMTAAGIRVEVCLPPSGGAKPTVTKPATTARQTTAGTVRGTPAQFPCNCHPEINGDPNEGLDSIKPFKREDFRTPEDCKAALGDTRNKWQTILLGHAPEDADRDDVLGSGPGNKVAKDKVKACKLHAPLFRVILGLRGPVNKLFSEQWPEEYRKYRAHGGHNGNGHTKDTGDLQCAECPPTAPKVNKLFPKPVSASEVSEKVKGEGGVETKVYKTVFQYETEPSVCGECLKRLKAKLDRPIRDARDARKAAAGVERRKLTKGPTGEQGGKGGKKGKGRKKGKH